VLVSPTPGPSQRFSNQDERAVWWIFAVSRHPTAGLRVLYSKVHEVQGHKG